LIALVDGDIISYRIGFTTEDVPVQIACSRVDAFIGRTLECLGTEQFKLFLTSTKPGYRHKLYPEYKANRKTKKPLWYAEIREHMRADYDGVICEDIEADDALGINQTEETVICTIDKDLDQVPGEHFDFVKEIRYTVTPEKALRFFYFQLLMGDRVDNIPGVPGVGPKKANIILEHLTTEEEYVFACLLEYYNYFKGDAIKNMTLMGQLLKIKQREDEPLWQIPDVVDLNAYLKNTSTETVLNTSTSLSI
jgi:5'-3' exonuclease